MIAIPNYLDKMIVSIPYQYSWFPILYFLAAKTGGKRQWSAPLGEAMTVQKEITDRLNDALPIEHLAVIDESSKHNVPPGAESHFKVVVVSSAFEGKKRLARHRMLNGILADTLSTHIHALALHTLTTEEWSGMGAAPASPACRGGDG